MTWNGTQISSGFKGIYIHMIWLHSWNTNMNLSNARSHWRGIHIFKWEWNWKKSETTEPVYGHKALNSAYRIQCVALEQQNKNKSNENRIECGAKRRITRIYVEHSISVKLYMYNRRKVISSICINSTNIISKWYWCRLHAHISRQTHNSHQASQPYRAKQPKGYNNYREH